MTVEEIPWIADVAEPVSRLQRRDSRERARREDPPLRDRAGNLVALDLRDEAVIHPMNRFTIDAMYPEQNIRSTCSGRKEQNIRSRSAQSIVDCASRTNVGELMPDYGGGGHARRHRQVENDDAALNLAGLGRGDPTPMC